MFTVLLPALTYTPENQMVWHPGLPLGTVAADHNPSARFSGTRGDESPYHTLVLAASDSNGYPHGSDWQMATTPISANAGPR